MVVAIGTVHQIASGSIDRRRYIKMLIGVGTEQAKSLTEEDPK
jgi:hypothetical protein